MSIINNTLLLGSGDEGYNLTRSLRFRSSASASLSRTPASAGNRQKFTLSFWTKRGAFISSDFTMMFASYSSTSDYFQVSFDSLARLNVYDALSGLSLTTTRVYRDPSSWYHFVIAIDTTQATASNRARIYVNNVEIAAWAVQTYPTQNTNLNYNNAVIHRIAASDYPSYPRYYDGYMTEINFIDAQQLTPSSFGETDLTTGVWKPKAYLGTYGTNGFELQFTDNSALTTSSNAGLGKDFSGNGNYWTTNNISITSGVTYDSMTDVPTLTSATAANFAVLNPLDKGANVSVTEGNLLATISSTGGVVLSSIGISSGKWYWEMTRNGGADCVIGIANSSVSRTAYLGSDANGWGYIGSNGNKVNNGSSASYGSSYATNIVIGVALDMDSGTVTFYRNNVSQGTAYSSLTGTIYAAFGTGNNTDSVYANFGQRPFAYTPPTGYVALNTYNLPTPTIVKGNTVMDVNTWTGNGSTQTITNAAGFKPDLVWVKSRSLANGHALVDSVRGASLYLQSNSQNGDVNDSTVISAINTNGFSVGSSSLSNANAATQVGWQWQAGQGSTSSNTSGTITSTVSVNASAGFSIATYTGTGVTSTIGHGLGVAPSLIIAKSRTGTTKSWIAYHQSLGAGKYIFLNDTAAAVSSTDAWNNTTPTSSVFNVTYFSQNNESSTPYVAYCWTPIAGYSAFGSYTGNGSTDGPFVYLGFRPKFIIVKRTDVADNWYTFDSARSGYNYANDALSPNLSDAEYSGLTYNFIDLLSNGFKMRDTYAGRNASGGNYIYMAFAENPFKNSLAR